MNLKEINMNDLPEDVKKIFNIFDREWTPIYLVGGCVRDMLLGTTPKDYDFTVETPPENIENILRLYHIPFNAMSAKYGTIVARIGNEEYEITSTRKEADYVDNRHPEEVIFGVSIEEDLKRRDFTINAMAMDSKGNIIDSFDGNKCFDMENHLIKTVGNPETRFKEDPLRIMRALRFSITKGFQLDAATQKAMVDCKDMLNNISKERITAELRKILTAGVDIQPYFASSDMMKIIKVIIPELGPCMHFEQHNKYHHQDVYNHILSVVDNCKTDKFEVKLAALLHDIGKPQTYVTDAEGWGHFYGHAKVSRDIAETVIDERLSLTAWEKDLVLALVEHHDMEVHVTEKCARRMLNKFDHDFLSDFCILRQADRDDHVNLDPNRPLVNLNDFMATVDEEIKKNTAVKVSDLAVRGNDLMDTFHISGPTVGQTLKALLDAVMDERVTNDKDTLLAFAAQYLEKDTDLEEER